MRPNFKSPQNPIVWPSKPPWSARIVTRSVSVCVGWECPPSPAFITGTGEYFDARSAAPSLGERIAITST